MKIRQGLFDSSVSLLFTICLFLLTTEMMKIATAAVRSLFFMLFFSCMSNECNLSNKSPFAPVAWSGLRSWWNDLFHQKRLYARRYRYRKLTEWSEKISKVFVYCNGLSIAATCRQLIGLPFIGGIMSSLLHEGNESLPGQPKTFKYIKHI